MAICGGAEACLHPVSLSGFAAACALSTNFKEQPELSSRPFDRDRDGFVMGEGAGILVIESLEYALARGAKPIAEIVGMAQAQMATTLPLALKMVQAQHAL